MLLLASWVFVMSYRQAPSMQALALFGSLAGAMMFVGGFSGMGTTADCLSSEKREGTLGLLFLTPLRGYDVVLGKLCAGSLTVLYGLVSVTPLLALPLLMGGVSAGEFGRMALLMVNTMWLSLAIGIWVSSVSRDEKRARGGALLLMVLFAGGFPLIGAWLEHELRIRGAAQWFMVFSPGYAFACTWDKARFLPPGGYWNSMLVMHLMTWIFLGLACWLTPRTWRDRPVRRKGRWLRWIWPWTSRETAGVAAFRRRLLDRNAFFWLSGRPRFKPGLVWAVFVGATLVWLGFGLKYPRDMFDPAMLIVVAGSWNFLLKGWLGSEATRQIAVDRHSGSIELLLSTPLRVSDISSGLGLSLKRQFGGPVVAVLCAECWLLLLGLDEVGRGDDRVAWIAVWICGMSMLVADLLALYAVGLWQSAVAKGPAQAAGGAVFRILALPWILYMLLGAVVAVADGLGILPALPMDDWVFWLVSWVLIGFAVDLFFGVRAWKAFHSRFREVASRRTSAAGWGAALGRLVGRLTSRRPVHP